MAQTATLVGTCTGGGDGATSTGSSVTLSLPPGCQPGDVAVISCVKNTGTDTATAPTGWETLSGPDVAPGNVHTAYCWGRVLTADDITAGTVTVTWSAGGRPLAVGVAYTGIDDADPFGPIGVVAQGNNVTTLTLPTITTEEDGAAVLALVSTRIKAGGSIVSGALPAAWTVDNTVATAYGSGVNFTGTSAHILGAAPGVYGGGNVTLSPDAGSSTGYTLALRPVADVPPEEHEGGSATPVSVGAVGDGAKSSTGGAGIASATTTVAAGSKGATGGAALDVTAATTGDGAKHSMGGTGATATAAATGAGTKAAAGGHDLAAAATPSGAGIKSVPGGSTATATATVTGGGEAHHPAAGEGGSNVNAFAVAAGGGTKAASGGSTTAAAVAVTGGGAKAALGGSILQAMAAATALGIKAALGGSQELVTVATAGGGLNPDDTGHAVRRGALTVTTPASAVRLDATDSRLTVTDPDSRLELT